MTIKIKFITYNIDGLNGTSIQERLDVILAIILSENADIIHLQEVVPEIDEVLTQMMTTNGYQSSETVDQQRSLMIKYYTLTFVRTARTNRKVQFHRMSYSDAAVSHMGRDLLISRISFNSSTTIETINTHGESCGIAFKSPESKTRMAQVTDCLERIGQNKVPSLVAGDLNIRDTEAAHVLTKVNEDTIIPHSRKEIQDVGMVMQGNKCEPTWLLPSNAEVHRGGGYRPTYRFDRVYINDLFTVTSYRLIGTDPMYDTPDATRSYDTPSDHFGIVCDLSFDGEPESALSTSSITSSSGSSMEASSSKALSGSSGSNKTMITSSLPVTNQSSSVGNSRVDGSISQKRPLNESSANPIVTANTSSSSTIVVSNSGGIRLGGPSTSSTSAIEESREAKRRRYIEIYDKQNKDREVLPSTEIITPCENANVFASCASYVKTEPSLSAVESNSNSTHGRNYSVDSSNNSSHSLASNNASNESSSGSIRIDKNVSVMGEKPRNNIPAPVIKTKAIEIIDLT